MGGGVVKGLVLQGFASLCTSCCGSKVVMLHLKQNISKHNVILNLTRNVFSSMILTLCLESEQHTADQNTTFSAVSFQECFFLYSILEKTLFFAMILMPALNSALYRCTYYHIYIHIQTLFDKFIGTFHNSLCFSKNMYLVLNRHECNFQLQSLHFLKRVLHPFMLFMSAFQKRTCPDWTCTSSKDGLTTIESRPFPGIIYILP